MDKYQELHAFLRHKIKKLRKKLKKLTAIRDKKTFPVALESIAEELRHLADHATHEIQDLKPVQEKTEEFQITDELCEEAFRTGLAARDFSIGFLQRRFLIGFGTAVKLRDKLLFDKKITRAFLAGDVLCKG